MSAPQQSLWNADYFNAWRRFEEGPGKEQLQLLDKEVVRQFHPGDRVLQFCSGTGRLAEQLAFAHSRLRATCVECNSEMVAYAKRTRPNDIDFIQADARLYRPATGFYDAVILSALHLLDDFSLGILLEKACHALAPNGAILLTTDMPERLATAKGVKVPPDDQTLPLDTSWDGAREVSYLRSDLRIRALLRILCGVDVQYRDEVALPDGTPGYKFYLAHRP